MYLADSALSAFQTAAGVPAAKVSVLVRTLLLAVIFCWALWCVYGEVHHFYHRGVELWDAIRKVSRILLLVVLMMSLVFIST